MANNMAKVNIEEIMGEIRSAIKREQVSDVDVPQIMDQIRTVVRETPREAVPAFDNDSIVSPTAVSQSGLTQPVQMPEDGGLAQQIVNEANYIKSNHYIPYYRDMGKGPKSFFKRIIRKLNRCNVLPISDDQNTYNLHLANAIDALRIGYEYHDQLVNVQNNAIQAVREELYQRLDQLTVQNNAVQALREELSQRLDQVIDRLEGQWSAIELLQEQADATDALDYEALKVQLSQIEAVLASIRVELREHGSAIKKQRQEQFVNGDRLITLQQRIGHLERTAAPKPEDQHD